jgi:Ras-related protein Rab-8A
VFLTYDITRDDTFVNVLDWMKEVKQHASSDIVIYLIGNRSDLEDDREVTQERAIEFCKEYSIDKFFETSAKTGNNVEETFSVASKELYVQQKEAVAMEADTPKTKETKDQVTGSKGQKLVKKTNEPTNKKKSCC